MTFDWKVSLGDIIALCAMIGSVVMFILTSLKQSKSKDNAKNANSFYDAAKKYYDLMVDLTPSLINKSENAPVVSEERKKASCDASIVRMGSNKWVLKVFNKGNANATDISFKYLIDDAPVIIGAKGDTFPIKLLEPQKNVDYHLGIFLSLSSSSWEYEIEWTNVDGTKDSKIGVMTLPLT